MRYTKHFSTKSTSQRQPIPGRKDMVKNNAGGYVFKIDSWARLARFLTIGSEGGTYYVGEAKLTVDNAKNVIACIEKDGVRVVQETLAVSDAGRAPSNDAAIFVLALCVAFGDEATKKAVEQHFNQIVRTGTHLFTFVSFVNDLRGWGRYLCRLISNWYTERKVQNLALQLIKYRNRAGWSHRDVLRVAHARSSDALVDALFRWVTHPEHVVALDEPYHFKYNSGNTFQSEDLGLLWAFQQAQRQGISRKEVVKLITDFRLPREGIPTEFLGVDNSANLVVWDALLQNMPMTAMIRNLGNMTRVGLLKDLGAATTLVTGRLRDTEYVSKSRIHPINVLVALKTYARGQGVRGSGTWKVVPQIKDALEDTFYAAFGNVEPTGKPTLLGLDVSGSMSSWGYYGYASRRHGSRESTFKDITSPAELAAATAMVTARTEPNYAIMAFSNTFKDLKISAKDSLDAVMKKTRDMNFGSTDCSLPFTYAEKNRLEVDVFCVYTDNETWAGAVHPAQALKSYRNKSGRSARSVVCAFSPTVFTIADPNDPLAIDISGFDSATPAFIADFSRG